MNLEYSELMTEEENEQHVKDYAKFLKTYKAFKQYLNASKDYAKFLKVYKAYEKAYEKFIHWGIVVKYRYED